MARDGERIGRGEALRPAREAQMDRRWYAYRDCCIAVTEYAPVLESRGTLLFLHGRFSRGESWLPVIEDLSNHYRCFLLHLPGFGVSYSASKRSLTLADHAQIAIELLQVLAPEGAILIGHDIGGAIAQLASFRQERTQGLVLLNSASVTHPLVSPSKGYYGRRVLQRRLRKLIDSTGGIVARDREALLEVFQHPYLRAPWLQAVEALERSWPVEEEQARWRSRLQGMLMPVLLLWGERDVLNSPQLSFDVMREVPEAYLFHHPDCGHWANLENPSWVVQKLRGFLFHIAPPSRVSARAA